MAYEKRANILYSGEADFSADPVSGPCRHSRRPQPYHDHVTDLTRQSLDIRCIAIIMKTCTVPNVAELKRKRAEEPNGSVPAKCLRLLAEPT